jgi:hypothetical protein
MSFSESTPKEREKPTVDASDHLLVFAQSSQTFRRSVLFHEGGMSSFLQRVSSCSLTWTKKRQTAQKGEESVQVL